MILLNACSIEKRHSMFGYHIEWRNNKFLDDKKVVSQKSKLKVVNKKAKVETDLILETKKIATVINQEIKSDIVSTSNQKSKFEFEFKNKSKKISNFKIPIIKESSEVTKKKLLLPIKRITKIPISIIVAFGLLVLGLLFFLIASFAPPSKDLLIFYLIGTVLLLAGIISMIRELLVLLIKLLKKV